MKPTYQDLALQILYEAPADSDVITKDDLGATLRQRQIHFTPNLLDRSIEYLYTMGFIEKINTDSLILKNRHAYNFSFARTIADIAVTLIHDDQLSASTRINEALARITDFTYADRGYIFYYDFQKGMAKYAYESCATGIKPQINKLPILPIEEIGDTGWISAHLAGNPVIIENVGAIKNTDLQNLLSSQDIKSLITVPILSQRECLGFVGFDSVESFREYGKEEVMLLGVFAKMLANLTAQINNKDLLDQAINDLNIIVEGTGAGTWIYWPKSGDLAINDQWASMLGYSLDELEPITISTWESLSHPQDVNSAKQQLELNISGKLEYYDACIRMGHKDGSWRWIQTRGRVVKRSETDLVVAGIHQDVTERELSNLRLQQLSDIITNSPIIAFQWRNEPGWPIVFVGGNIQSLGYTSNDFINGEETYGDLIHPDDLARIKSDVAEFVRHGPDSYTQTYRILSRNRNWVWVEDFTWLTRDIDGKVTLINGVIWDVSSQKAVQDSLAESESLLREAQEIAMLGHWSVCPNSLSMSCSDKARDIMRLSSEDKIFPIHDFFHKTRSKDKGSVESLIKSISAGKHHEPFDLCLVLSPNNIRWVRIQSEPRKSGAENGFSIIGTVLDITERVETQKELDKTRERFQLLFEKIPASVLLHDAETGDILEANERALKEYSVRTAYELNRRWTWNSAAPYRKSDALEWIFKAAREGEQSFEWCVSHLDQVKWEKVTLHPLQIDDHLRVLSISIDITARVKAERALSESEERFRGLLEHLPNVAIQGYKSDKRISFWNKGSNKIYGYSAAEVVGKHSIDLLVPEDQRADFNTAIDLWLHGNAPPPSGEIELIDKNGDVRFVFVSYAQRSVPSGTGIEFYRVDVDLTDQKSAQKRTELLASVFSHSHDGVTIMNSKFEIIEVNDSFCRITKFSRNELIGKQPALFNIELHEGGLYRKIISSLSKNKAWAGTIWSETATGEKCALAIHIAAVINGRGKVDNYIANISDITEQINFEKKLNAIAYSDSLTGLPNRTSISEILRTSVEEINEARSSLAVIFIDLDEFKKVNDTLTHSGGDRYLQEVAKRLTATIKDSDVAARYGGDEFILLIRDIPRRRANENNPRFQAILSAMQAPLMIDGRRIPLSASLGVTFYPQKASVDADQLLRQADQAMYSAKQRGKNQIAFFDAELELSIWEHHVKLKDLRTALQRGQLVLFYQPQVDLTSGDIFGIEALIRWKHPIKGLLSPHSFLGIIQEDEQLNLELSKWVLSQALADFSQLDISGSEIGFSVNVLMPRHGHMQHELLQHLESTLSIYADINPHRLTLEIVENTLLEDIERAIKTITAVQALGVKVSMDDFGTGFSSLSYLKHLSFDELKIDQGFVQSMLSNREDMTIVQAVISLSQSLNIQTIAEGAETPEHIDMLIKLGCTKVQGYTIARPMPLDVLSIWMRDWVAPDHWKTISRVQPRLYPAISMLSAHYGWLVSLDAFITGQEKTPPSFTSGACGFDKTLNLLETIFCDSQRVSEICSLHTSMHQAGNHAIEARLTGDIATAERHLKEAFKLLNQLKSLIV